MRIRSALSAGAVIAGLAYFYGLILGGLSLAWQVLFREGLPTLAWWQWLLAPLALGVVAMGAEALIEKAQTATGFGAEGQTRSKRALHLLLLFCILTALILGPALLILSNP